MSGYTCDFNIYEGKDDIQGKGLGYKVVTSLYEELYDKNYWIFFDNFFTSIPLMEDLLERQTFACGTVRAHSKGLPQEIIPFVLRAVLCFSSSVSSCTFKKCKS